MKKMVYLMLLFVVPFSGFAQWGDPDNKKVDANELQTTRSAQITWTAKSIDIGRTLQNNTATASFELTNTGNAPLIISRVDADCDCTAPEWPKKPIMPGQKATITLQYDASSIGQFQKGAIVTANTSPAQHSLVMTGVVDRK
jgi:hypothetical protein